MYQDLGSRSIYKFRKELQDPKDIREHFIFKFDTEIEVREIKKLEDFVEEIEVPKKEDNLVLCILKRIKDNTLHPRGEL